MQLRKLNKTRKLFKKMNKLRATLSNKLNNIIGRHKAYKIKEREHYDVINFCITHKEPELPLSDETIRLEIGEKNTLDRTRNKHVINCFSEIPALKKYRHELVIISGLLTAARHLARNNINAKTVVNFTTYRLFVLPHRITPHSPWPQMNHVTHETVLDYKDDISFSQTKRPWLLPMFFANAPLQKAHERRDGSEVLGLFLKSAIDEGVLNDYHAFRLRNKALHLTAMGIGRMPVGVFVDISKKAEIVTFRFLRDHLSSIPESNRFKCALYYYERLAVYLMEDHIEKQYGMLPSSAFGFWTLVNDKPEYLPGKLEVE
ncbi:hypothetical protein PN836_016660 [Ningiella sp. W23]|uniref:hypothetical protein n=1 Tax=Ningiella sp. W23 TaxID=3023715 RepID=UPI003757DB5F